MRILFSVLLILVCFSAPTSAQRCQCAAPAAGETTREGANADIVVIEKRKHTAISGIVRDPNGQIVSDVLVEVFDHPEHLLLSYPQNIEKRKEQHRVAACVIEPNGRFCFTRIPPGKYEVRFSKNGGWGHSSIYMVVAPRNPKATRRGLAVTMWLGA